MEITCGMCRTQVPMGATVCTGCQGTVIYGPTDGERKLLAFLGIILALVAFHMIASRFDSMGGMWVNLIVASVGAGLGSWAAQKMYANHVRTFRRLNR